MGNQIPNIAFQIAFCYQIGIGAKSDDDLRDKWLKKSNRQLGDLKAEKKLLWTMRLMNNTEVQRFLSNGMIYQIELIKEYQKRA
jgi:hypothetical protein